MMNTPPEFMPPSPYHPCEGYWDSEYGRQKKGYMPKVSTKVWPEKESWVQKALFVCSKVNINSYRGFSHSRIDNSIVGSAEYEDKDYNMIWPDGYIEHYIRDHNVMPTQRFYDYVNRRYDELS